jgi:hypothetical protein
LGLVNGHPALRWVLSVTVALVFISLSQVFTASVSAMLVVPAALAFGKLELLLDSFLPL